MKNMFLSSRIYLTEKSIRMDNFRTPGRLVIRTCLGVNIHADNLDANKRVFYRCERGNCVTYKRNWRYLSRWSVREWRTLSQENFRLAWKKFVSTRRHLPSPCLSALLSASSFALITFACVISIFYLPVFLRARDKNSKFTVPVRNHVAIFYARAREGKERKWKMKYQNKKYRAFEHEYF